jgi:hypothetical protein
MEDFSTVCLKTEFVEATQEYIEGLVWLATFFVEQQKLKWPFVN